SDQQPGAIRKNAPQEDALQALALRTDGGLSLTLAVIADGEGRQGARALADLAVQTVVSTVQHSAGNSVARLLQSAVEAANAAVVTEKGRNPALAEAYAGLTVAAIHRGRLFLAHAGHTSAYLVRNRQAIRLTEGQVAPRGKPVEAAGLSHSIQPDLHIRAPNHNQTASGFPLRAGDHVILCSDGLTGNGSGQEWRYLTRQEMVVATEEKGALEVARRLATFPMSRNVDDNVSVIVLRVPARRIPKALIAGLGGVTLVVLLTVLGIRINHIVNPPVTPTPTLAPDEGLARLESAQGQVRAFAPGDTSGQAVSSFGDIPARSRVHVTGGATLVLRGAAGSVFGRAYPGPETDFTLTQIDPQEPAASGQVIITITSGELLIVAAETPRTFVVRFEGAEAASFEEAGASMGVTRRNEQTWVDCLAGRCWLQFGDSSTPLQAGQRVRVAGAAPSTPEGIPQEARDHWGQICGCSP
ncbi:MAG: SpoIIE family protein phosphatase, partial [Chloroflexi bacterium]|nr:SpoIIE family protein phosphatase [Chloroflexota bacterium]